MDPQVAASLEAYETADEAFVERAFCEILRRPVDDESRERALAKLADGTLSRATFLHELATAAEAARVRELDDAVSLGLGARRRGERLAWLQAPPGTDERVIEIPWVLSRLVPSGRVLEVGYAFAEPVYLAGLVRAGLELVGVDLAERDVAGLERIVADVRSLPLPDGSVDQVLLVSTLEHVGADNTAYGLEAEADPGSRADALRELGRVLRPGGTLLVTVPLGEPGDRGWFRLDDVRGWTELFASAGLFVEEQEAYELTGDGWRPAPGFRPQGVGYGDRGPAASAVLCTELSRGRLRRLATPDGLARTLKRRARPWRHHDQASTPTVDFDLTDEQREIQALAREVADTEIAPNAAEWDREHRFPRELFARLGELGLMGVCVPEELGGAGADFVSYVLVLEELSRADAGVGVTVAVHTSAATLPIVAFGTEEQRGRFVPPLARGEAIGAFALTEPGSGSDAGSLRTTAVPDGDGWRLTGTKQWCTNGSHASTFILFARTDPERAGARGVSAFVLDAGHVEVTREEEKLGLHSSSTADLRLDGALVGRDRLLHEERKGFTVAMATLDAGRIGIASQAVGIAQAALDTARAYALEREQFGRRIADFQAIQFTLADMATEIAAARALTLRAARLKEAGLPHGPEGAMAKLFASRVAVKASQDAIQVLGGYGYTREFPAERYYRDAKITEIYEGTSEIQRIVIARDLLRHADRTLAATAPGTVQG